MQFQCPVCGYPALNEVPRSNDGGGSYEICPCCGFQFGIDDEDRGYSYEQWREEWRAAGAPWRSVSISRPDGWNAERQLKDLGPL